MRAVAPEFPIDAEGQVGAAEDELGSEGEILEPELGQPIVVPPFQVPAQRTGPDPVPEAVCEDRQGAEIAAAEGPERIGDLRLPIRESLVERPSELAEPSGEEGGEDAAAGN